MSSILARFPHLPSCVVIAMSGPAYFLAYQANPSLHFGIGRWDEAWLADGTKFYPPLRLSGPFRRSDGSVEVHEFAGRLTKREAGFRIPFHGLRSPIELALRCHRFGLQGTVVLTVNDRHIGDFVFTQQSYPWGGIRAVVPQAVAERGPLRIDLAVRGGDEPPNHLPSDLGLGVDWLEVAPLSRGVVLLPTPSQWASLFLLVFSGYVLLRFLAATPNVTACVLLVVLIAVLAMLVAYPVTANKIVSLAWLLVGFAMPALWLAELVERWH